MSQPTPINAATITLADGKQRTLLFTMTAIKRLRDDYKVSVLQEGTLKLFQGIDENRLSSLLALGLDHKYDGGAPGITAAEIDELLTAENTLEAVRQLDVAFGRSLIKNALDLVEAVQGMGLNAGIVIDMIRANIAKTQPPTDPKTLN